MPTSQQFQISNIVNLVVHLKPNSVLDIGPGFGKYGLLCREYLELWEDQSQYDEFKARIDCIEVFKKYLTPVHEYVYSNIYVGNAAEIVPTLNTTYELTLMIDVLEHFPKDQGKDLLKVLFTKTKNALISVPKDVGDQGEMFENEHEAHHAEWSAAELLAFGQGFIIPDPVSTLVFIGTPEAFAKLRPIFTPRLARKLKRAFTAIFQA